MSPLLLAGDIGGTKINLACFSTEPLAPILEKTYWTADYDSLESLLSDFLGPRAGEVRAACFGVAGPVKDGRVELTNVRWPAIDERTIRAHLGLDAVAVLNDMMAMAYGALVLPAEKLFVLNPGSPDAVGNAALIAAGTGLGEALMHYDGKNWQPSPSEGGHTDFAPLSEIEIDLLRYLQNEFGHVSYERILSGPGIYNIYRFLRDTGRGGEPAALAERFAREDPSAVISELALAGKVPICEQTLEIFVHLYGAEAGNMALKGLATGGVFIGGGIAPKILPMLRRPPFMQGFRDKGRFCELLEKIPVKVILEPKAPLYGAAHYASLLLRPVG